MSTRIDMRDSFAAGNRGERPDYCEEAHLDYLDWLRESGATNMFGARPYLMAEFPDLTAADAAGVLGYWMKSFGERRAVQQPTDPEPEAGREFPAGDEGYGQ
ncbi:MAG TPA: hypothetical protein VD994_17535 [Prosthecobacter sp.]|nr:hypothetical protein [Prosthecobacter sp.]